MIQAGYSASGLSVLVLILVLVIVLPLAFWNVAALERSDNVADPCHAFAGLKRGYSHRAGTVQETEMRPGPAPPILPT